MIELFPDLKHLLNMCVLASIVRSHRSVPSPLQPTNFDLCAALLKVGMDLVEHAAEDRRIPPNTEQCLKVQFQQMVSSEGI